MASVLSFIKMHGCGNDYIFVDCFSQSAPADPGALARTLSDRHTSVGSDGLVLMLPSDTAGADARMRMFNSDGSEGALCGNALRCFAMWLTQTGRAANECRIAMHHRIVAATVVTSDASTRSAIVRVNMGTPVLSPGMNTNTYVRSLTLPGIPLPSGETQVHCVSMGNPHAVLFLPDLQQLDFELAGPAIERHREFPDRTNVEFVEPAADNQARVRVWERGSGETQACGSGACAVAVAGISTGVFRRDRPVVVQMQGGPLQITWSDDDSVLLQGPAAEAFRGTAVISD